MARKQGWVAFLEAVAVAYNGLAWMDQMVDEALPLSVERIDQAGWQALVDKLGPLEKDWKQAVVDVETQLNTS